MSESTSGSIDELKNNESKPASSNTTPTISSSDTVVQKQNVLGVKSSQSTTLNHFINSFSPPSVKSNLSKLSNQAVSSSSSIPMINSSNKFTIIPFNLNKTTTSPAKIVTTPVKVQLNESSVHQPHITKNIIQLATSNNDVSNITGLSAQPPKVFTINNTNIQVTSITNTTIPNSNKVQYVKIVNSNVPPAKNVLLNDKIKITPVSSNNTLTNVVSQKPPSLMAKINENTSHKPIVPQQPSSSSVLLDAISNSKVQVVNTSGNSSLGSVKPVQRIITAASSSTSNPKPQLISSHQAINQPTTKTIITTTTATSASQEFATRASTNYKLLTQQLPPPATNVLSSALNNPFLITKTVSSNATNDESVKNQFVTTMKTNETKTGPVTFTKINSINYSANGAKVNQVPITSVKPTNSPGKSQLEMTNSPLKVNSFTSNLVNIQKQLNLTSSKNQLNEMNDVQPTSHAMSPTSVKNIQSKQTEMHPAIPSQSTASSAISSNARKPCNCTKSMCLKLYCDCFAMGAFCHDCNCINCFNTLEHEDERNKAVKLILERNPQAFQSKIGKFSAQITLAQKSSSSQMDMIGNVSEVKEEMQLSHSTTASKLTEAELDEIQSRHIKGCNCRKSNCLKRYCECYLAKIQCSTLCKCIGCKNCDDSTRAILQLNNQRQQQQQQQHQKPHGQLKHQSTNKIQNQNDPFNQRKLSPSKRYSNFAPSSYPYLILSSTTSTSIPNQINLLDNSLTNTMWRRNNSTSFHQKMSTDLNKFNNFDLFSNQQKLQIEHQQDLSRSYALIVNESIESTCSRLVELIEDNELKKNAEAGINNAESALEEFDDDKELIESLLIQEFGKCLENIIDVAEKRKS